ncbi:MAG: ferredoxin family protein, partial [Planctomycetes bacterium]|nr:ferredoxin family protein [Planctomycetota bacterium]
MAKRLTVVISQGQSANPAKRDLEESLVAALLMERGVEVTVIPHLYDLAPDGTGMLCLQGIAGDMVVLSWLYPRAARWIMDRNQVRGHEGTTLLVAEADEDDEENEDDAPADGAATGNGEDLRGTVPSRKVYCIDLRVKDRPEPYLEEIRRIVAEMNVQTVPLTLHSSPFTLHPSPPSLPIVNGAAPSQPAVASAPSAEVVRVDEPTNRRWYPVIDYSRCTNCMECLDFCLFGVYGVDRAEAILVEQPDNCRKGCPACSRVCP